MELVGEKVDVFLVLMASDSLLSSRPQMTFNYARKLQSAHVMVANV